MSSSPWERLWNGDEDVATPFHWGQCQDAPALVERSTPPLPSLGNGPTFAGMEVAESVQCPFCGQAFELVIDTSLPSQRFTTDCEVCCRPFEVVADCEPGEILGLDVLQ